MPQYEAVLFLHSAPLILNIIVISTLYLAVSSSAVTSAYKERISCTDPAISLSYKDSTISGTLLHVLFMVLPLILLSALVVRRHYSYYRKKAARDAPAFQELRWRCTNKSTSPLLRKLHLYILGFAIGACTTILLTDLLKYGVGRPRPHFLKLCMPHACVTNGSTDFNCSNSLISAHLLKNLRLSFPSGHSSLAAYASTL